MRPEQGGPMSASCGEQERTPCAIHGGRPTVWPKDTAACGARAQEVLA